MMISVILPIYNAAEFLDETISSVLNQTYRDFELILIDDGSNDNSLNICKNYNNKYSNIKLISQDNKGVSEARNRGYRESKGEWILFLDSDDILDPKCLEIMIKQINDDSDIIVTDYLKINSVKDIKHNYNYYILRYTPEEYLNEVLNLRKNTYAWGTLIKRNILSDIEFPTQMFFEDLYTMYKVYMKTDSIIYINCKLLFYRQHNNSIVATMDKKKRNDYILACDVMCADILKVYPQLKISEVIFKSYVRLSILKSCPQNEIIYSESYAYLSENLSEAIKEMKMGKQKIKFLLFRYCRFLYDILCSDV